MNSCNDGLVTYSLKINGSTLPETCQVYSIEVEKTLNRIATAVIVVLDGSAADEKFPISASAGFLPGNVVRIESGYDGANAVIFEGIVVRQSLQVNESLGSALEVTCKDKAIGMTVGRKSNCFKDITDSSVISQLIENTDGLSKDVAATSQQLPQLVQYYCSDWDLMLTRAEVNGLLVSTINGKVSVFEPSVNTSSVLTVTYGENMYSFDADLDAVTQLEEVKASAWDYKSQKLVSATAPNSASGPGNLSSEKLSHVIGLSEFTLQTSAPLDEEDLTTWAKAQMLKSEFSKIAGTLRCPGQSAVEPGDYVTIVGMGPRFDGDHLVSSVGHDIADGNWFLNIGFGLPTGWFVENADIVAPRAAGLLPGVQGLYNATVMKSYEDPDSQYRILIDLPLFDPTGQGLWARLSNFYSTSGAGAFFLPEVGDEVVVGFLNDDPRYPIILGSLYSATRKPYSDVEPDEKNTHKGIITNSGLRILFNDENDTLQLVTPAENKCVFSDKDKQILMQDQTGNKLEMSPSGITISSPKAITIKADETVAISGETGITIDASGGDVSTSGINIKESADAEVSIKADTSASVNGGMELSMNAAMITIN